MIPQQLCDEVEELRREGYVIDLMEIDGYAMMIIDEYPVPSGYSKHTTKMLLKFPMAYPNGRPDMFWTDGDFILQNGAEPNKANVIETINGRQWRRFSWHPQAWNPGRDDLRMYLEFVNDGLAKARG